MKFSFRLGIFSCNLSHKIIRQENGIFGIYIFTLQTNFLFISVKIFHQPWCMHICTLARLTKPDVLLKDIIIDKGIRYLGYPNNSLKCVDIRLSDLISQESGQ